MKQVKELNTLGKIIYYTLLVVLIWPTLYWLGYLVGKPFKQLFDFVIGLF